MKIKVCDSLTGSGKTSAAIHMMNSAPEKRYLFITPYLSEVQRIQAACPVLDFREPESWPGASKLTYLEGLLRDGHNVVSTHALFTYYRAETLDLIRAGGYTLIMDEVMNVIEPEKATSSDMELLIASGTVEMEEDGQHVRWLNDAYNGKFRDLKRKAEMHNLIYYNNMILFWSMPVSAFSAFEDIYLLTYLFRAQMQCYYYQIHGLEVEYIGTRKAEDGYVFTDTPELPAAARELINKIHILDNQKLNSVGEDSRRENPLNDTSLSSRWFLRRPPSYKSPKNTGMLARNMYNIFHNIWKCRGSDVIWTVFKSRSDFLGARGYRKGFIPCSLRATNDYADRHYAAYCINVFFDPRLRNYFLECGAHIDEDAYALSEMIQWVWRSAIRRGEEIWLYVPSRRMRFLFQGWLERLSQGEMF